MKYFVLCCAMLCLNLFAAGTGLPGPQGGGSGSSTLADGSVTTAKLANNAVTAAKVDATTVPTLAADNVFTGQTQLVIKNGSAQLTPTGAVVFGAISGIPHVTTPTYDGDMVDTTSAQTIVGPKLYDYGASWSGTSHGNNWPGLLRSETTNCALGITTNPSLDSLGATLGAFILLLGNTSARGPTRGNIVISPGTPNVPVDGESEIEMRIADTDVLVIDRFSNILLPLSGTTMSIKSGTNQRAGNATLVGGTVTVANTTVTANTIIILTTKTVGGTIGTVSYTVSAGTSFTINSANVLDTSTITYLLLEVN